MKKWKRFLSSFLVMTMAVLSLAGCKEGSRDKEDKQTITVYLWTANLYDTYAPYVQSQLPDVDVEFVVGNNDLDFYTFLNENAFDEDRKTAMECGMNGFISKPIDIEELVHTLETIFYPKA